MEPMFKMWTTQILIFLFKLVIVLAAVTKDQVAGNSPQSLPLTAVNSASVFSDYWTTFLNISYVDTEQNLWHTEKTEVAR